MKKAALILPVLFLFVLVGAGCSKTGSVEVETDDGTASETQEGSTRRRAPRAEGSQDDVSADNEESAQEAEEEEVQAEDSDEDETSASATSTAELEELADEVDSLLGGMEAGESGF